MQKKSPKRQQNKVKGQKFESLVQKTINSGQLWFSKGDLQTDDYLIECKMTDQKGYRITTKLLKKLWDEALTANKLPALVIGITDEENPDMVWLLNIQINRKRK